MVYQQGSASEAEVACDYFIDKGEIRFALVDYDCRQTLRIDPALSYAARLDATLGILQSTENIYAADVTESCQSGNATASMLYLLPHDNHNKGEQL